MLFLILLALAQGSHVPLSEFNQPPVLNGTTTMCAGGGDGSYAAYMNFLVSSDGGPRHPFADMVQLPNNFYSGLLINYVDGPAVAKVVAMFDSDAFHGEDEVDMDSSVGGHAISFEPSRGANSLYLWDGTTCTVSDYHPSYPITGCCWGANTFADTPLDKHKLANYSMEAFGHFFPGYMMGKYVLADAAMPVFSWGGGGANRWMGVHLDGKVDLSSRMAWLSIPSRCQTDGLLK